MNLASFLTNVKHYLPIIVVLAIVTIPVRSKADQCDLACLKDKKITLERQLADVNLKISQKESNPRLKKDSGFWLTLDFGVDLVNGLGTGVGVSFPVGPVFVSPGIWHATDYSITDHSWGWYLSVGYSITLL